MKWQRLFNDNKPQRKCALDAATIAAVGSLALNGVGSVMGATTAAENNEATRMWQTWMTKKNQEWSERMWNLNNEYNSPLNQRMLAEQGGYNPYLLGNEGNLGSGSSLPSAPATPAAPNALGPINPLQGFSQGLGTLSQILLQGQQVESNVELQNAKGVQTLVDTAISAYDKLGIEGYRNVMDEISPMLSKINMQGSRSDIMFNETLKNYLSQRYNMDMDSLNKEIEYNLGKKYGEQRIQANLEKLSYEVSEIVGRLNTMHVQNEALIKQTAADLVVKGAHAFMLKQEGSKFAADAETANQLRQWLTKTAQHNAEIREIDSYFSKARQISESDKVGFMTSKEGRERVSKDYQITTEQRSSDLIRAMDKVFGEYVSVSGSFTPHEGNTINRYNSNVFPTTYSTNYYPFGQ